MRVLVTKLQKVERMAFAPEGTHLFASGLHSGSLGYGDPDTGIDVFDLAGAAEPTAHVLARRDIRWFAPLSGGRLVAAHRTGPHATAPDFGLSLLDWRAGRDERFVTTDRCAWFPCAPNADGSRLIAAVFGRQFNRTVPGLGPAEHGIGCWPLAGAFRLDWDLDAGREVRALAVAPDGRSFWTAERDLPRYGPRPTEFVPRTADTGAVLRKPVAYPNQKITDLALGPSFAVAHDGAVLFVYDLAHLDQKPQKVSNPAKRKHFAGFAIHPSGKWLATAGLDGAVSLWNTANWNVAQSWTWDAGQARGICFSADGALAAAGTDSGKIIVWDLDL